MTIDYNQRKDPYLAMVEASTAAFRAAPEYPDADAYWDRLTREENARVAAMTDILDLCGYFGLRPSLFKAMYVGVDEHDEPALDKAIRAGIHKFDPNMDGYAYLFVRAVYRPLEAKAQVQS